MSGEFDLPNNIPPPPDYPAPYPPGSIESQNAIARLDDEPLHQMPQEERLDGHAVEVVNPGPPPVLADNLEQLNPAPPIAQMQVAVGGPEIPNKAQYEELITKSRGSRMLATAGGGSPDGQAAGVLSQQVSDARRAIVGILEATGQLGGQPGINRGALERNALDLPIDGLSQQSQNMVSQLRDLIVQNQKVLHGPSPDRGAMRALVDGAAQPRERARTAEKLDPELAQVLTSQIANGRRAIAQLFKSQGLLPDELQNADLAELESHIDRLPVMDLSFGDRELAGQVRDMIAENLHVLNNRLGEAPGGVDFSRPLLDSGKGLRIQMDANLQINNAQQRLFQSLLEKLVPAEVTKGRGPFGRTLKAADGERAQSQIAWGYEQVLKSNADARAVLGTFTSEEKEQFLTSWTSDFKLNPGQKEQLARSLGRLNDKYLPMPPTAPGSRLAIGGQLGAGGAGEVFSGTFDGRPVIVKKLTQNMDAQEKLFEVLHEITMQGRAEADPHIPKVVGLYEENGTPFIVMERVQGPDLKKINEEVIQNLPPINRAKAALQMLGGAIRGLAAMHDKGLIHRDIKPDNIMFDTNTLEARLIDFGISLTGGALVPSEGSVAYAAPENDRSDQAAISGAVDVYSLGSTLYTAVGGELWSGLATGFAIRNAQQGGQTPGAFNEPGIWNSPDMRALQNFINATWAREPSDRPTIHQMRQAFNGEVVTAAMPGENGLKAADLNVLDVLRPDHPLRQGGREILAQALAPGGDQQ